MHVCMHACMHACMYVCMYINIVSSSPSDGGLSSRCGSSSGALGLYMPSFEPASCDQRGSKTPKLHCNELEIPPTVTKDHRTQTLKGGTFGGLSLDAEPSGRICRAPQRRPLGGGAASKKDISECWDLGFWKLLRRDLRLIVW